MNYKFEEQIEEDELNKRIDIIGQNGNDGLHYDEIDKNKNNLIGEFFDNE
jgi:hypothetical protein